MKRLLLAVVLMAGMSGLAFAENTTWSVENRDTTRISDKTDSTWDKVKKVVDRLDPQAEAVLDFRQSEWTTGFSAAVLQDALGSARIGYAVDKTIYGALKLELAPVSDKLFKKDYVPGIVRAARLAAGPFVGYSWDYDHVNYGIIVGTDLRF